jgi:hypothetical protein
MNSLFGVLEETITHVNVAAHIGGDTRVGRGSASYALRPTAGDRVVSARQKLAMPAVVVSQTVDCMSTRRRSRCHVPHRGR